MSKEEFIYEIIDKYFMLTCIENMFCENYYLCNMNFKYYDNSEAFSKLVGFYSELENYQKKGQFSLNQMDEILQYILQRLRQRECQSITKLLCDAFNVSKEEVKINLFYNNKGEFTDITLENFLNSVKILRSKENMHGLNNIKEC